MSLLQPTASKTHLLLNCQWPFGRDAPTAESTPEMDWGNAFHEVMQTPIGAKVQASYAEAVWHPIAAKYQVDPEELTQSVLGARRVLRDAFIKGENAWGIKITPETVIEQETSYAIDPRECAGRRCAPVERETHTYPDLRPGEIGGTVDLAIYKVPHYLITVDYKTGWYENEGEEFKKPSGVAQLLTLTGALWPIWQPPPNTPLEETKLTPGVAHWKLNHCLVGILHAPRGAAPRLHLEEISSVRMYEHQAALEKPMERIGDGSLRPGSWCKFCPARDQCPTTVSMLNAHAAALMNVEGAFLKRVHNGGEITAERLGEIHELLGIYEKQARAVREELREKVRALGDGAVVRPDGKSLVFQTRKVERISKEAFVKALGHEAGEAELDRLRELGVLTTKEEEYLMAVAERGA